MKEKERKERKKNNPWCKQMISLFRHLLSVIAQMCDAVSCEYLSIVAINYFFINTLNKSICLWWLWEVCHSLKKVFLQQIIFTNSYWNTLKVGGTPKHETLHRYA